MNVIYAFYSETGQLEHKRIVTRGHTVIPRLTSDPANEFFG